MEDCCAQMNQIIKTSAPEFLGRMSYCYKRKLVSGSLFQNPLHLRAGAKL